MTRPVAVCFPQMRAARYDIHEIFFEIPAGGRLALLQQDRELCAEKKQRDEVSVMAGLAAGVPAESSVLTACIQLSRRRPRRKRSERCCLPPRKDLWTEKGGNVRREERKKERKSTPYLLMVPITRCGLTFREAESPAGQAGKATPKPKSPTPSRYGGTRAHATSFFTPGGPPWSLLLALSHRLQPSLATTYLEGPTAGVGWNRFP